MSKTRELVKIGQLELTFLHDETDTNNNLVIFEFLIPPGAKVPIQHYHVDVDEVIYGLEGVTTTTLNGVKTEIRKGDSLFIPRGAVHHHDNRADEPAKSLIVLTPALIGPSYFKEIGSLIQPGTPPDPQKVSEIMLRYGLVPQPD